MQKSEPAEEGVQRRFELTVHLEDWQILMRTIHMYLNFANPPELASFLIRVGKLDQRRENLFDNPRALIFVICKNLQDN